MADYKGVLMVFSLVAVLGGGGVALMIADENSNPSRLNLPENTEPVKAAVSAHFNSLGIDTTTVQEGYTVPWAFADRSYGGFAVATGEKGPNGCNEYAVSRLKPTGGHTSMSAPSVMEICVAPKAGP